MNTNRNQGFVQAMAFASQLFPAIIGLGSFMILVRVVQAELLGQFLMYISGVVLFEMIKSGGLQSALVMRLSGREKHMQLQTIGSAYWLGAVFSGLLSVLLAIVYFSKIFISQPGIQIFCCYYTCLGIVTLPLHIAEAKAVATQDISFLFKLRLLQSTNSLAVALYAYFRGGSLEEFATVHLLFNTGLVVFVIILRKTNPLELRHRIIGEIKELFKLIRYTLATLATTNLLKSADNFLIGSILGTKAVATYAVPLKLTELFEIPLRSLCTTAFPQLAATNNNAEKGKFKKLYVQYLSWAYLLYIPALIVAFIIAPFLVTTLGGNKYLETVSVFRVFLIFGLLLPADRMTGIALDALQKPKKNFIKVLCMASVNIIGDVLAIKFFGQLEWVALASVLNVFTGIVIGNLLLKQTGVFHGANVYSECIEYCRFFLKASIKRFRFNTVW